MAVELEKAKKIAKEELLKKISGVVGVSAHHSKPVIRIYVEKLEPSVLKEIPPKLLGYDVEIIETGRVEALINRKARYRPVFPGISIGSALVTAGTLSQICRDNKTGELCLLSNRHVFWGDKDTPVYQPGPIDGGTSDDTVGYITRFEEIKEDGNIIDASLCSLEVKGTNEEPELGKPLKVGEVKENDTVIKAGRTTGVTTAKVIDCEAVIKVYGYENVEYAIFDDVVITSVCSSGGDSGSPSFNMNGELIGLVFAGSDKITVICKAKHIVNKLNITPIYGMPKVMRAGLPGIMLMGIIPAGIYLEKVIR